MEKACILPNLFVTANRGSQLHRLQWQVVVADVQLFDGFGSAIAKGRHSEGPPIAIANVISQGVATSVTRGVLTLTLTL